MATNSLDAVLQQYEKSQSSSNTTNKMSSEDIFDVVFELLCDFSYCASTASNEFVAMCN